MSKKLNVQPSILVIGDGIGLPNGYAPSSRLKYLAASMASHGNNVEIVVGRPSDFHGKALNKDASGEICGVKYKYMNSSPVYSSNTVIRRMQSQMGILRSFFYTLLWSRSSENPIVFAYVRNVQLLAVLSLAARLCGARIYLELCEWQEALKTQSWHERLNNILFSKYAFRLVDGVVCISEYIQKRVEAESEKRHLNLKTVRVPILSDKHEFQDVLPMKRCRPYLMYCGNLVYQDTLDYLLKAFKAVAETDSDIELLIAGSSWSDSFAERFRKQVSIQGLEDRVSLLGYVSREDLLKYYAGSEALVIPLFDDEVSRARFPTKISEYLFSTRPVVTTAIGEAGVLLRDGVNAYVSPSDSICDFSEAMQRALSDSNRNEVGKAGYETACSTFDYRQYGRVLSDFFISR